MGLNFFLCSHSCHVAKLLLQLSCSTFGSMCYCLIGSKLLFIVVMCKTGQNYFCAAICWFQHWSFLTLAAALCCWRCNDYCAICNSVLLVFGPALWHLFDGVFKVGIRQSFGLCCWLLV